VHKSDAVELQNRFFGKSASGKEGFLQKVGIWAVLKSMRERALSIEDQAIIMAIVWQESRFHAFAKNRSSTACGLYQLIAATGLQHELKWWRCMDPLANARAGTALYHRYRLNNGSFLERLRCSYLKHYYGRGSGCGNDPSRIWQRIGTSTIRRANLALETLRSIEAARAKESLLATVWRVADPYLPFLLLFFLLLLMRSFRKVT
jgi:hypothetical protein